MSAMIEARGLGRHFGGHAAVREIDLDIAGGTIAGVVGPDGAGKSTLLRMLAGLLQPDEGHVRIAGIDPVAAPDRLRDLIGYMPQRFGLYEDLSVQENLDLYADLRNVTGTVRRERMARLLAFSDLADVTGRPAGKLSGGMKQKLGLACVLVGEPRVLILDEPGVGVDPVSRRSLWQMVRTLAADGMTIIWSTAYLDEAERCDTVSLLHAGRLHATGTPASLMAGMTGCTHLLGGIAVPRRQVLQRALNDPAVLDGVIQGRQIRLVLRTPDQLPDLDALQAGPDACLQPAPPRLEDAFISLLGGGPGGDSPLSALAGTTAAGTQAAVIEARALTRRFGDFVAADRISFAVGRGEVFGLLGPNGAGKSTTFRMECGLLAPTSGQALVDGLDLARSPSAARQRLGYMAQRFSLYGQLTVRQNLRFFAGAYGLHGAAGRARIDRMVAALDLGPWLARPADAIPPGFRQRLALACALMHAPAVLFLDEPTSGVDPVTRREFWNHINALAGQGVTVLVTTHFMDEAEYCDRVALVYRGRVIAMGTPDALKQEAVRPGCPDPTMEDAFVTLVTEAAP